MYENLRIGIIGYGQMGQAIASGLLQSQTLAPTQLYACAKHYEKLNERIKNSGIHAVKDAKKLVSLCDWIILAVKPQQVPSVITQIKTELCGQVIVSIAAGIYFNDLEKLLPNHTAHISTIPNTPISVAKGILICEEENSLNAEQLEIFEALFGQIALIKWVASEQFSIAGTLCGCAPAFTAIYIEALADAAVQYGLKREEAYEMAAAMIVGTGTLYLKEKKHPGIMKDQVCSPGGTTIKGVNMLEKRNFRKAIIEAMEAIEG